MPVSTPAAPSATPPLPLKDFAPKTLRLKQAVARYGVGRTTMWALAARGVLHPVRVSKRVTLWRVDELDAYFTGNAA
jgi:predicted DNA-binding transcriptional regulator AlpA